MSEDKKSGLAFYKTLGSPLHEGEGNSDGAKLELVSGPTKVE